MSNSSDVKEKQNVGLPINLNSGCRVTDFCMVNAVSKILRARSRYPSLPSVTMTAQVAAMIPPERLPPIPGETYVPPTHSGLVVYWCLRKPLSRYTTTDVPLGPYAYLCVSAEMDVTPGMRKSMGGMSYPSCSPHGR